MSARRRRGQARHKRRQQTPHAHRMRPNPRRPLVTCWGGPLAGCDVRIDQAVFTQGAMTVPGRCGRYVRTDGEDWTWETDHNPERNDMPIYPAETLTAAALFGSPPMGDERLVSGTYPHPHWTPGDPCNACGSTRTVWAADTGGECLDCHRTDADQ